MEHFYHLPNMGENWFTFPALYSAMVSKFPSGSHFVEIGSWKGKSAAYMGVEIHNSKKNIKFDCIDIWSDQPYNGYAENQDVFGEDFYALFLKNIEPVSHIITPIRKDSSTAASDYADGSLDFVFIDADHTYEGVKKDLIAWYPKVKKGGIFSGHDYGWTEHIRQAVDEVLGKGNYADKWGCGCFMHEVV